MIKIPTSKNLAHLVSNYDHPPIAFFDNLNMDLITYSPELFVSAKRKCEQLGVEIGIITGNAFSTIGDHDSFARMRDYTGANFKRKVSRGRNEVKGYYQKELNELEDKMKYFKESISDWNIKEIFYAFGSHDQTEIIIKTVARLNSELNKFELNTLRQLGDGKGRTEYYLSFTEHLNNYNEKNPSKKLDAELMNENNGLYSRRLNKIMKSHDLEFFGKKPTKKMKSKSDFDQDKIHNWFRESADNYRLKFESLPKVSLVGFNLEKEIYNHKFKIKANQTTLRSPSLAGFSNLINRVRTMDSKGIDIPDFIIQGMHGTFNYKAMRLKEGSHEYVNLLQIPCFEDPIKGFNWDMLQTNALETSKRHSRIMTALGVPVLYVGNEDNPHIIGWMDKKFLSTDINPLQVDLESLIDLSDLHLANQHTFHGLVRKGMDYTVEFNPDYITIGGDLISGGHWPGHDSEDGARPTPKSEVKKLSLIHEKGGWKEVGNYLEKFNLTLHKQKEVLSQYFDPFINMLLNKGGDKTFYINDGHHGTLLTKRTGKLYSIGTEIKNKIIANAEKGGDYDSSVYDENFDLNKTDLFQRKTNNGIVRIVYNSAEIKLEENLNDKLLEPDLNIKNFMFNNHSIVKTHQRKGGAKGAGMTELLHGAIKKGHIKRFDISMTEHFHSHEITAIGDLVNVASLTFEGRGSYGDTNTYSKGGFLSDIGFNVMLASRGNKSMKVFIPYTSDKLRKWEIVNPYFRFYK